MRQNLSILEKKTSGDLTRKKGGKDQKKGTKKEGQERKGGVYTQSRNRHGYIARPMRGCRTARRICDTRHVVIRRGATTTSK